MCKTTPDLGKTCPAGHPSGRIWEPPVSVEQAKARVVHELDHLEMAHRDRADVGYAERCFNEAMSDYSDMLELMLL